MSSKVSQRQQGFGIGLLELMMTLAIISIISILSVRYYQAADSSQKVSEASDMVGVVRSAMRNFHNDYGGNYSSGSGGTEVSLPTIQQLVSSGYLPPAYGDGVAANPWNGNIAVIGTNEISNTSCQSSGSTEISNNYAICLSQVPAKVCPTLVTKINGTINSAAGESVQGCTSSEDQNNQETTNMPGTSKSSGTDDSSENIAVILQY